MLMNNKSIKKNFIRINLRTGILIIVFNNCVGFSTGISRHVK